MIYDVCPRCNCNFRGKRAKEYYFCSECKKVYLKKELKKEFKWNVHYQQAMKARG